MVNIFAIFLAEDRHVYQPRETISGWLVLNTDMDINLRGVRVVLHGLGHVSVRSGKVTYVKNETYLNFQTIVLGRGPCQPGSNMKLQTGNYKYPFQFPLPPHDLPTSFEGSSGSVRYWLDAVLDRGSWKTDIHIQKPLFIVEHLEIRDPTLFRPSVKREDRTLGWPCCPAGQLLAKARIDRLAYCPGQEVKISGYVSNESSKQVVGMEIQLVQTALYKARESITRTGTKKVYVFKNELRRLAPGEETSVEFDSFVIPSVQPTTRGFGCIDISYEIRFIVRVAKAFNTEITIPVIIATLLVPPNVESSTPQSIDPRIYSVLANYLASRHFAAELANRNAEEETERAGYTFSDGSGAQTNGGERSGTGRPYRYSRLSEVEV